MRRLSCIPSDGELRQTPVNSHLDSYAELGRTLVRLDFRVANLLHQNVANVVPIGHNL